MKNDKNCPHCGNTFEGRANKIYCSDKCKMAAFKQAKTQEKPEMETVLPQLIVADTPPIFRPPQIPTIKVQPKEPPKIDNNIQMLQHQIELRRLELEYQQEFALLQSQDRGREINFELRKMQLTFEQEKQGLQREIENLQKQNLFILQEKTPQALPLKIQEVEQVYEVYEEEKTETQIILPQKLRARYCKFVTNYLGFHKSEIAKERAQKAFEVLCNIQTDFELLADANGVEPEYWEEYEILSNVRQTLHSVITDLSKRAFFQSKVFSFLFSKESYERLKESIVD